MKTTASVLCASPCNREALCISGALLSCYGILLYSNRARAVRYNSVTIV